MFSSKWWSPVRMAIVGDEDGGCARIAISPSFPNLLYTVCRSSNVSPLPDTFSTLFLFRDNFDGEVFLLKSAVKYGVHHVLSYTYKTVGLEGQLLLSSRVNLWVIIISRCAKTFSSASCMCVEGRLQGRWFVDGKVPSIRMQFKWETFFLTSFLNNVIESAKQKKFTLPAILS